MPVSAARKIAFETLRRVESEGAYATDVLHAELDSGVQSADAALATELTLGVLRWRRLLDFLIERHFKKPLDRLDLAVLLTLRMGLYQLRFLERIPARAAVHESVEMVKVVRKASAATLVNAILRRSAAELASPVAKFLPPDLPAAERLGILYSHPTWLVERWLARLDEPRTIALLEANNRAPRLTCAVHDLGQRAEIIRSLEDAGLHVAPGFLLSAAFAISGGSPTRTDAFRSGQISIQDEASQAIPVLLGVRFGHRVLDLCAAPGGKTSALVRAAAPGGLVVAADRHEHRLRAMQSQFRRLGLSGASPVELDAARPLPFGAAFDRILLDAPCSGTGTLARHPEIRWRLRPEQLVEFHALQSTILRMALAQLAPGGRLVYSTCSIEPEENEDVAASVFRGPSLDGSSFRRLRAIEAAPLLAMRLAPGVDVAAIFSPDGTFRTSPAAHLTDGFFAVILEKRQS